MCVNKNILKYKLNIILTLLWHYPDDLQYMIWFLRNWNVNYLSKHE